MKYSKIFNVTKKKLVIALLGFILSFICAILLICICSSNKGFADAPLYEKILRIISAIFLASSVGFISYIIAGLKGYLVGFSLTASYAIFAIILSLISKSSPKKSLFLFTFALVFIFSIIAYNDYKNKKNTINEYKDLTLTEQKNSDCEKETDKKELEKTSYEQPFEKNFEDLSKDELENIDDEDYIINKLLETQKRELEIAEEMDRKFLESIGFLKNSIILYASASRCIFQTIKNDNGFLFHYIGKRIMDVDDTKFIKDFSNVKLNSENKKDYFINLDDIENITVKTIEKRNSYKYSILKITLKNGKTQKYKLYDTIDDNDLNSFFGKISIINSVKKSANKNENIENKEYKLEEKDKTTLNKLNKFFLIFSLFSYFTFGLYIFAYNYITYAILTFLCLVICLTLFIVYIKFQKYLSLTDKPNNNLIKKGKIGIIKEFILFPVIFALFSTLEVDTFVYYDLSKFLIISAILFLILITILFIFTKEYKKEKSVIFVIIISCILLSPSVINKVNTVYDFSRPQKVYCQIIDNPTETNKKDEITYYLKVKYKNKNKKIEVSKETYEKYGVGDKLLVYKHFGALGIEYSHFYE